MQNKLIYLSLAVLTCFGIYFFGFQRENAKSWDKALHIFGGLDQVFNPGVLMPRDLWNAARFIHREMVSTEPRLNWGEYERRSSIDCAIRAEYLCRMAYVRSEGLCHADTDLVDAYFDPDHGKHVDILGKLNVPQAKQGMEQFKMLTYQ